MRRMSLIVATAVIAGVVAAARAQGQDDPATCLSLVDFTLRPATIVGTPGDDTLRGTEGPDVRRRDVADAVVDELIELAQQIVAHAAHSGTPYSDVARS